MTTDLSALLRDLRALHKASTRSLMDATIFRNALRDAFPALAERIEELERDKSRLKALVYDLSDGLADEGPDWSDVGLDRLRRQAARELPHVEWLQPYLVDDIADEEPLT